MWFVPTPPSSQVPKPPMITTNVVTSQNTRLPEYPTRYANSAPGSDAHAQVEELFASRTRDEWAKVFEGTDACVSPVLTFAEAPADAHMAARANLVDIDGVTQAQVAPRFSRTKPETPTGPTTEATDPSTLWAD